MTTEHIIITTKKYDGNYSMGRTVVVVILCHKKSWLSAFAILIKKALLCQTTPASKRKLGSAGLKIYYPDRLGYIQNEAKKSPICAFFSYLD